MTLPVGERAPEVRSMLVIHQGAIGDFILALPVLASLRRKFPEVRSVIMGYPRILSLVEGRFYAEEICSIDQKGMATFFVREGPLDQTLARFFETFDLIIVFAKEGDGALISNLRRVNRGSVLYLNPFPKWDEGVHLVDHLLTQLDQYGISRLEPNPRLHLNEEDRQWGKDFWERKGVPPEERRKAVILHPGSGSKKKIWPLKQFINLFRFLQARHDGKFLVILGPAEGPEIQKNFAETDGSSLITARGLSLVQLASVMDGCCFFVGNDSGISHMAAALGVPTVALFGPTDYRVWSPRGEKVAVVRREIPCSPCSEERFFLCKDFQCLNEIGLSEVLNGLKSMGMNF